MNLKSMILQKYGSMRKCAIACGVSYHVLREVCSDESRIFMKSSIFARDQAIGLGVSVDQLIRIAQESEKKAPPHRAGRKDPT